MTAAEPPPGLSRASLAERTLLTLSRGRRRQADVLLVRADCGLVVVKDYASRPRSVRTLGRWLVRREVRAYRALADHPAVPRYLGRIDELAFAVEHRGGPRFSPRRPWTFSPEFARALEESVEGLHRCGVAHLDLGHRSNVRADVQGRPVLIDFASAVTFPAEGLGRRLLLPLLAAADRRALRKWSRQIRASRRRWLRERSRPRRESAVPGVPRSGGTPRG